MFWNPSMNPPIPTLMASKRGAKFSVSQLMAVSIYFPMFNPLAELI